MDREQRRRLTMIDAALASLHAGFVGDRGALTTPASSCGGSVGNDVAAPPSGRSGGVGSVGGGASVLSAATVTRAVRRQDIVVAADKAKQQVSLQQLAPREQIDALVRQLRQETPIEALPPPVLRPASSQSR
jgi:hypothetical protein